MITLNHQRLYHTKGLETGDFTLGFLSCEEINLRCFILEDTKRDDKIAGKTRIWSGRYELQLRKELSPLTIKHREAYKELWWFKKNPDWWHIEITGIKDFKFVYYHAGIDDSHTDGCNLPCYGFDMTKVDNYGVNSRLATNDFYSKVHPLLESEKRVFVDIVDEKAGANLADTPA